MLDFDKDIVTDNGVHMTLVERVYKTPYDQYYMLNPDGTAAFFGGAKKTIVTFNNPPERTHRFLNVYESLPISCWHASAADAKCARGHLPDFLYTIKETYEDGKRTVLELIDIQEKK